MTASYSSIKSVELKNNTYNIKNKSITGRTFVADFGNSYWTIKIKTAPMTKSSFFGNFINSGVYSLFYHTRTKLNRVITSFILPVWENSNGTASGTVTVVNANSTTPAYNKDIGSNKVGVSGGSGTLKAGDLIKFSGHSKVYMLTADTNLDGSSIDTISFTPRLLTGVGSNTITYNAVPFQVIPEGDVESWKATDGSRGEELYQYEQTFREVIR